MRNRTLGLFPILAFVPLIGALFLAAAPARAAVDHVAMPFQCKIERGRVVLSPTPVERIYEVTGGHRQQPHLFCAARDERRCRPRTVHRFEVMCGNTRTSWVAVAAAATRMLGHEAWIDGGRLNVVVGVGTSVSRTDCGDPSRPHSITQMFTGSPSYEKPCNSRFVERGGPRVITLPVGFAPLSELGARMVEGPTRPVPAAPMALVPSVTVLPLPVAVSAAASSSGTLPAASAITPALMSPAAATSPNGVVIALAPLSVPAAEDKIDISQFRSSLGGTQSQVEETKSSSLARLSNATEGVDIGEGRDVSGWHVAVRFDEGPAAALVKLRAALATDQWLFAIGLLTATLAVGGLTLRTVGRHSGSAARRRRSSASVDQLVRRASLIGLDDPDERVLSDLRSAAEQLRSNAELLLKDLASAPPLRGVLRQEVDLIAQRLSDVPRSSGIVGPRQIRQRYQGGIRELHRVIKIAEGAAASFSSGVMRSNVPTTREEAYDMLGVNDSISEGTLKKLVDALRMSWHPDHARDEADRQRREERIKQINVAWDLITGKRLTA